VLTYTFETAGFGSPLHVNLTTHGETPQYPFDSEFHCADYFEIIVFVDGNGHLELDQNKLPISPGTVVFISPFQKRRWFIDRPGVDCYFIVFKETFFSDFFTDKLFVYRMQYFYNYRNPLYMQADESLLAELLPLFSNLRNEFKALRPDSPHVLRSQLYFMLIRLNRDYALRYHLSSNTLHNNLAFKFKQQLDRNIRKETDSSYYATLLGISRVTLNKHVKNQFGITLSEMIRLRLLSEIKNELLFTSKTISEIAFELHFSEPNHLTRFFKKMTGMTPVEFRETYQSGKFSA
jgi:AraC family transcriptional regulator, transcriptional activator of pobA